VGAGGEKEGHVFHIPNRMGGKDLRVLQGKEGMRETSFFPPTEALKGGRRGDGRTDLSATRGGKKDGGTGRKRSSFNTLHRGRKGFLIALRWAKRVPYHRRRESDMYPAKLRGGGNSAT